MSKPMKVNQPWMPTALNKPTEDPLMHTQPHPSCPVFTSIRPALPGHEFLPPAPVTARPLAAGMLAAPQPPAVREKCRPGPPRRHRRRCADPARHPAARSGPWDTQRAPLWRPSTVGDSFGAPPRRLNDFASTEARNCTTNALEIPRARASSRASAAEQKRCLMHPPESLS